MPRDYTAQNALTWQQLIAQQGGGLAPPEMGFHSSGSLPNPMNTGVPVGLPTLAPQGQYYVYPDGNRSNVPGPGAMGPFSDDESKQKAFAIKGIQASASANAPGSQPMQNATMAANPKMITPYQRSFSTGGNAFGESDLLGKRTLV